MFCDNQSNPDVNWGFVFWFRKTEKRCDDVKSFSCFVNEMRNSIYKYMYILIQLKQIYKPHF